MNDIALLNEAQSPCHTTVPQAAPRTEPPGPWVMNRNRKLGAYGESLAVEYLEGRGYRVLERNWRAGRAGELDIIACDRSTIVAIEVKTRSGTAYGHPLEAITTLKARRLRRLLFAWVQASRPSAKRLRVDAIGIVLEPGVKPRLHHLQGIA